MRGMQTKREDRKREEIKKEQVERCICGSSCVCNKSTEVKGIPESVSLSASSSLSANSANITSWFLFIHFMFVFYAPPPPVAVISTSGIFVLGYIWWVYCRARPATYII